MGPIKYSLLPASIANLLNILLTNQSIRVTRGRMSRLMRTLLTQLYCDEKGRLFNKVFPIENPAISSLRFNELHPFFRKSVSSHFRLLMLPPIHMESIYNRDNLVLVHNSNFSLENLKLYRDIFDGMTKKMVKKGFVVHLHAPKGKVIWLDFDFKEGLMNMSVRITTGEHGVVTHIIQKQSVIRANSPHFVKMFSDKCHVLFFYSLYFELTQLDPLIKINPLLKFFIERVSFFAKIK